MRIRENIKLDIKDFHGLAFCKDLSPKDLYFSDLPMRIRERLIFPLCNKCALEEFTQDCEHNDNERSLVGVWTTMELKKAIELNYNIAEIYEVWHFPKLSPNFTDQNGFFKDFINSYIKLKVEAILKII